MQENAIMERYIIKTRLIENPNVIFYFKGKENEESPALNSEIALDISKAKVIEKGMAYEICEELNKEKEELNKKGFAEFEMQEIGKSMFEEACRYAVGKIDIKEIYYTFGIIEKNRCPLNMVGNNTEEKLKEFLNYWGVSHGLEKGWYKEYGDEEEALYKGYDILNN